MIVEDKSVNVEDLNLNLRDVNMKVTVVSKSLVRHVRSRGRLDTHRVCDVLVGEEIGSVYLTPGDNAIEKVHENDTLRIENGYIKLFRGSMRLNIGKHGKLTVLEDTTFQEVNTKTMYSIASLTKKDTLPTISVGKGGIVDL